MKTRLLATGFCIHLVSALVVWLVVDTSGRPGWYNKDFAEWIWLSGPLVLVMAAVIGMARRSWRAALIAGAGATVALVLECAVFVAWAVSHSA
jgi:predicted secreted protein